MAWLTNKQSAAYLNASILWLQELPIPRSKHGDRAWFEQSGLDASHRSGREPGIEVSLWLIYHVDNF